MKLDEFLNIVKTELKDLSTVADPDFRIEQVEPKQGGTSWELIVSFFVENKNRRNGTQNIANPEYLYERVYKKVHMNGDTITSFLIYNNRIS